MGSLFDELKKSKLIDEKRARQLAHETRIERQRQGGDLAQDASLQQQAAEFEQRKLLERQHNREIERARREKLEEKEHLAGIKQLVQSRALGDEAAGPRRWHFESVSGTLPFLPVNEATARRLQAGELGIVTDPGCSWPHYVLVPREVALALGRVNSASVRFLSGA